MHCAQVLQGAKVEDPVGRGEQTSRQGAMIFNLVSGIQGCISEARMSVHFVLIITQSVGRTPECGQLLSSKIKL